MYTCKIIMYTCILNYVHMQGNYIYMQDNYVCMQTNHVYMQDHYVCMQDNHVYIITWYFFSHIHQFFSWSWKLYVVMSLKGHRSTGFTECGYVVWAKPSTVAGRSWYPMKSLMGTGSPNFSSLSSSPGTMACRIATRQRSIRLSGGWISCRMSRHRWRWFWAAEWCSKDQFFSWLKRSTFSYADLNDTSSWVRRQPTSPE